MHMGNPNTASPAFLHCIVFLTMLLNGVQAVDCFQSMNRFSSILDQTTCHEAKKSVKNQAISCTSEQPFSTLQSGWGGKGECSQIFNNGITLQNLSFIPQCRSVIFDKAIESLTPL